MSVDNYWLVNGVSALIDMESIDVSSTTLSLCTQDLYKPPDEIDHKRLIYKNTRKSLHVDFKQGFAKNSQKHSKIGKTVAFEKLISEKKDLQVEKGQGIFFGGMRLTSWFSEMSNAAKKFEDPAPAKLIPTARLRRLQSTPRLIFHKPLRYVNEGDDKTHKCI